MKRKNCPYCEGPLVSGNVSIHGSLGEFLLFGFSFHNLFFKPDKGDEIMVLGSAQTAPAMRCGTCGIVSLNLYYSEILVKDVIIDILTLCSSKELRDSLQGSNSDIDIQSEIIKKWKENYLPNEIGFKNSFTVDELCLLADFDKVLSDNNWEKIEPISEEIIEELNKE
jgi:hypothetical protein